MKTAFSKRIKELRENDGLSLRDLAEDISINHSTIANWERGFREPPFDTLIKIADYFDVTTDYLLGRTDTYA
ncbi:MAG: helix-turn-helix domain-containing protein [Firmicutes bacterium]|nr:helix-turn-helix domain-containing protein [Bacillota bacterium]